MKRPHFSYSFVPLKILSINCWTKALASQPGINSKFLNLGSSSDCLASAAVRYYSGYIAENHGEIIRPMQLQYGHLLRDLRQSQRC
jgi:hypothetical protein